eukprot:6343646-Heterocapsa_arctica.AAC.1
MEINSSKNKPDNKPNIIKGSSTTTNITNRSRHSWRCTNKSHVLQWQTTQTKGKGKINQTQEAERTQINHNEEITQQVVVDLPDIQELDVENTVEDNSVEDRRTQFQG